MGMSTYIRAFIAETDPEFQKHKRILLMCEQENVSLPAETAEYFGQDEPDPDILDDKLEMDLKLNTHYKEWHADMSEGFEVDLSTLPDGVKKIRFYNSW